MLKKSASLVLASLRGSTYRTGEKSLSRQALVGWVRKLWPRPLASLRPRWTTFLTILRAFCISPNTHASHFFGGSEIAFQAAC